ncbi:MAG TPA: glycosyltransferase family 2 protein [Bryobacteraceae bacterium]|nr:glycosyltransferase family 2 protein [Bryobacteraceae bacterium]
MNPGIEIAYAAAQLAARLRSRDRTPVPLPVLPLEPGISVVIPSRNGKDLLAAQLPGIIRDLPAAAEVLVVDNGSDDGTAVWLQAGYPQVRIELSPQPLSFAHAANRGLAAARYSRICLLNNDMLIDSGLFSALDRAFDRVPSLFCATAQIRFPPGVRREETGKAVMAQNDPDDFPLRCDEPLAGEDLTWVLYGSGGCSLYDASRLRALGGIDTVYEPAYVEDLDLGFRAWQRGWPSVYVAGAGVEHRHRATTSRYYSAQQLETILELNYLKFLARSVWSPILFRRLWTQGLRRLRLRAPHNLAARQALRNAAAIAVDGGPATPPQLLEESVLALTNGTVFVFPGRAPIGKSLVLVASSGRDTPRRDDRDQILVALTDTAATPSTEILAAYVEVVLVRRTPAAALAFPAAIQQTLRKWQPEEIEFEGETSNYARDIVPVRTDMA